MATHVVIQDRQGDHTASVFLKESFRPVVLLWNYICIYQLVITDTTKNKMVRLKRAFNMMQGVTIRTKKDREVDVWVGVFKKAVALDSVNPKYDGYFYKEDLTIEDISIDEIRLDVRGETRQFILRFPSQQMKQEFCNNAVCKEGVRAPCPSPSSPSPSPSPSPPSTTPSPPKSSSSSLMSEKL
ncbi:hypothetical protein MTP99_017120 [Tenebrio molitor]|nr:hypothetical protein MTP99_017120 [Tenebrio molitor]